MSPSIGGSVYVPTYATSTDLASSKKVIKVWVTWQEHNLTCGSVEFQLSNNGGVDYETLSASEAYHVFTTTPTTDGFIQRIRFVPNNSPMPYVTGIKYLETWEFIEQSAGW